MDSMCAGLYRDGLGEPLASTKRRRPRNESIIVRTPSCHAVEASSPAAIERRA